MSLTVCPSIAPGASSASLLSMMKRTGVRGAPKLSWAAAVAVMSIILWLEGCRMLGLRLTVTMGADPQPMLVSCWQVPVLGSQESTVHGLPSSQMSCLPGWQVPLLHTSPAVQRFPSSHEPVLLVCRQPPLEQESVVHGLPSSQPEPASCWQVPVAGLQE